MTNVGCSLTLLQGLTRGRHYLGHTQDHLLHISSSLPHPNQVLNTQIGFIFPTLLSCLFIIIFSISELCICRQAVVIFLVQLIQNLTQL